MAVLKHFVCYDCDNYEDVVMSDEDAEIFEPTVTCGGCDAEMLLESERYVSDDDDDNDDWSVDDSDSDFAGDLDDSSGDLLEGMVGLFNREGLSASSRHGLALELLDQDVIFFQEGEIAWDGAEHSIGGMQFNSAVLSDYPQVEENLQATANIVAESMMAAESNPSLRVPLADIHEALHELLQYEDMTGMTFMNLAAWHMLKVKQRDDKYAVMVDANLIAGIPDAYNLIAELLTSLRAAESIEGPFDIMLMLARNFDALDGVMIDDPVPGADYAESMKMMHVEAAPASPPKRAGSTRKKGKATKKSEQDSDGEDLAGSLLSSLQQLDSLARDLIGDDYDAYSKDDPASFAWTFDLGKRVEMPGYSLLVPDTFEIDYEAERGFAASPPDSAVDEAGVAIFPGIQLGDETWSQYEGLISRDLYFGLQLSVFYTQTSNGLVGYEKSWEVQGEGCDSLIVQTSGGSLDGRGFEFYLYPYHGMDRTWFRVVLYRCPPELRDRMGELVSTIAASMRFNAPAPGEMELAPAEFLTDVVEASRINEHFARVMSAEAAIQDLQLRACPLRVLGEFHLAEVTGVIPDELKKARSREAYGDRAFVKCVPDAYGRSNTRVVAIWSALNDVLEAQIGLGMSASDIMALIESGDLISTHVLRSIDLSEVGGRKAAAVPLPKAYDAVLERWETLRKPYTNESPTDHAERLEREAIEQEKASEQKAEADKKAAEKAAAAEKKAARQKAAEEQAALKKAEEEKKAAEAAAAAEKKAAAAAKRKATAEKKAAEKKAAEERAAKQRFEAESALNARMHALQVEQAGLGAFSGTRRAQIEAELIQLVVQVDVMNDNEFVPPGQYFVDGDLVYLVTEDGWMKKTADLWRPLYRGMTEVAVPALARRNGTAYRVTAIGARAFKGCANLRSVVLPQTIEMVASGAFEGCISLTSLVLPTSVREVWNHAFVDSGLTAQTVTRQNLGTRIDVNAFKY